MSNKKVLLICHLTESKSNGQVAKSRDTYDYLKENGYDVEILNYGKLNVFQKVFLSRKLIKKHERIVLMPGGKKALFYYINLITKFKKTNAHYVAIGGWVLSLLSDSKNDRYFQKLKTFKGVYLQNKKSLESFEEKGFNNALYVSNFSSKNPLTIEEFNEKNKAYDNVKNFKFCFFARVERTKGVLLACDVIQKLSEKYKDKSISLDIYGEIKDKSLENELVEITKNNKNIIIKGVLSGDKVIQELSTYYCMLFPTFYKGEGTPHTVIESFMAGLPVIASNWAYNSEIIENNKTGLLFELDTNELFEKMEWATNNPSKIKEYSRNCFEQSKDFNKEKSLKPLLDNLN